MGYGAQTLKMYKWIQTWVIDYLYTNDVISCFNLEILLEEYLYHLVLFNKRYVDACVDLYFYSNNLKIFFFGNICIINFN